MGFQTTRNKTAKRTEHVWHFRGDRDFKCVLCGALVARPPELGDNTWVGEVYEPLTEEERALCPYKGGKILD